MRGLQPDRGPVFLSGCSEHTDTHLASSDEKVSSLMSVLLSNALWWSQSKEGAHFLAVLFVLRKELSISGNCAEILVACSFENAA